MGCDEGNSNIPGKRSLCNSKLDAQAGKPFASGEGYGVQSQGPERTLDLGRCCNGDQRLQNQARVDDQLE